MNIFLQAAYKVQPDDVKTCHEFLKDYLLPFLIAGLGALTAYLVMLGQVEKQREIDADKENQKNKETMSFHNFNLTEIISDLKKSQLGFKTEYKRIKNESFSFYPEITSILIPNLELILKTDFKSHCIPFLADQTLLKNFNNSYRALMRINSLIVRINCAVDNYVKSYPDTMEKVGNILSKIFFEINNNEYGNYVRHSLDKYYFVDQNKADNIDKPTNYFSMLSDIKSNTNLYPVTEKSYIFVLLSKEGLSYLKSHELLFDELDSAFDAFFDEINEILENLEIITTQKIK